MKQKILQNITALLLIITLTMANFLLLCVNAVSYAAETINIGKNTNHKNIEFMAYFKDENENKVSKLDAFMNNNELKIYFQITVKQDGYFNGNILLKNANFKFKTEINNENINKIENNVIYLNQINAGESKEIEVCIEILKDEQFDLNLINMESNISIQGIYKNSTQKDISIDSDRNINLNLINPYVNEDGVILSQEIITNKIYNYNGEDKRIIQIKVQSGLDNNLYPIESTSISINAPKILDIYPENVIVNSNTELSTNGKKLSQSDWNYDADTGVTTIKIENKQTDNKVSWIKNGKDEIIITYIFNKDVEINNQKLSANLNIKLYDNKTVLEGSNEIELDNIEKDSIITTQIEQNERSIYKGKIYAGISREITHKTVVNINMVGIADEINVIEEKDSIGSNYSSTKLNKNNIQNILGQDGTLSILNAKTNEIISTISNETQADENGNIIINYPEGINEIKIIISKPEYVGNISIESTKTIGKVSKNTAKATTEIVSVVKENYISEAKESGLIETKFSIELKETQTSASLELNKTEISTMSTNSVEMRVLLKSRDENSELYKNPIIRIELPSKIETVDVTSINLVYEDEMKIKSANLVDGKIIEIKLEGQQTKYKEEAIEGALIIINANLTTSKKLPNSTENIILTYTNENVVNYENDLNIGRIEKQINLVSYAGVVTINKIPEYGVEIVNNEETDKTVTIDMNSQSKTVKIENEIINNNENEITNVKILGTLPNKDAVENVNNMDISIDGEISLEGISSDRAKIYYTENANATSDLKNEENQWSETITDYKKVKKYLAVINELATAEGVNVFYNTEIPENLDYNLNAQQAYSVYYTNMASEEEIEVSSITLSTPKGAMLETELKALVSGKEVNEVKENEVLRYEVNISNTGSEDITNVKVLANVPEGTTFVNTDMLNNEVELKDLIFEDENKKEVEINVEKLAPGENVTKYYEVKANKGMAGKEISNIVTTQYGEVSKTSNEVKTSVKEGDLQLKLVSIDAKDGVLNSGYQYRYVVCVTNTSNKNMKNVNITVNTDDNLKVSQIYYIDSNDNLKMKENTNSIEIDKLSAEETIELSIYTTVAIFKDVTEKEMSLTVTGIANKEEYRSNEVNSIIKSNLVLSMVVTSENSGSYVNAGDIIKYNITIKNEGSETANILTLSNWISNDTTLTKVVRNGAQLASEDYILKVDENKNKKLLTLREDSLKPGETIQYQIEAVVNLLYGNTDAIEILNEYSLKVDAFEIATAKVEHILQPYKNTIDNDNTSGDGNNGSSETNPDETNEYKIISGVAWIDENEDGQRDSNEKTIEGIIVKLLDVTKNEFAKDSEGNVLTTTTSKTGFYSFSKVQKGQYLVIFEYDTTQYGLTKFEKEGISNEVNSNVITKNINIEGTETKVATTEIINVDGENISNVNIGLIVAKKYDLQLDKFISKVTVQNNKTVTNNYIDTTLVKQEIDAKQVNSTIVVVEYTIRVTNKGDVTAYVKKIADYLSVDYKFNSELNKDWYQSGNDVYCTSLANEKIEPGESKEVVLTVIKEMKENNTGLINNTAEIVSSYNELGLTDINSTEGNKVKGENDMGSADLIIAIKTGQVIMTVTLIISTITILGIVIFFIRRIINNRKII